MGSIVFNRSSIDLQCFHSMPDATHKAWCTGFLIGFHRCSLKQNRKQRSCPPGGVKRLQRFRHIVRQVWDMGPLAFNRRSKDFQCFQSMPSVTHNAWCTVFLIGFHRCSLKHNRKQRSCPPRGLQRCCNDWCNLPRCGELVWRFDGFGRFRWLVDMHGCQRLRPSHIRPTMPHSVAIYTQALLLLTPLPKSS